MRALAAILVVAAVPAAVAAGDRSASTGTCTPRTVTSAYASSVQRAVASGRDVWGSELVRSPAGPTLAAAERFLAPLTGALQWHGQPLTPTGSYYLPLSFPFTPYGSTVFALHVADGSEIVTRRVGGPSLSIYVGSGSERYGACAARLGATHLAESYLPILQTSYTDTGGVRYRQESFVGRAYGAYGARSIISYVRLDVDARRA